MLNGKKICCIIPARKGSKQLKNKNLQIINNKPLFLNCISQAKNSKYIDSIYFNSDSKEMIKIAKLNGAICNFLRPKKLSGDKSMITDVLLHHINYYKIQGKFDFFVLMQPTSPLTNFQDIDKALEILLTNNKATSLICITEHAIPNINFEIKKNKNLISVKNKKVFYKTRRQELKKKYILCGALYISKVEAYLKYKNFIQKKTAFYEVEKIKSYEIDDFVDYKIIEALSKIK